MPIKKKDHTSRFRWNEARNVNGRPKFSQLMKAGSTVSLVVGYQPPRIFFIFCLVEQSFLQMLILKAFNARSFPSIDRKVMNALIT
jgi:hypothetical protein